MHALLESQSYRLARPSKSQGYYGEVAGKDYRVGSGSQTAVEAVGEAKHKADKLQAEIDKLQTDYEAEVGRLVKTADPVTHLQKSVREAFQPFLEVLKPSTSLHCWKRLSQVSRACWRLQRPRRRPPMRATTSICSPTRQGHFSRGGGQGPEDEREANWAQPVAV